MSIACTTMMSDQSSCYRNLKPSGSEASLHLYYLSVYMNASKSIGTGSTGIQIVSVNGCSWRLFKLYLLNSIYIQHECWIYCAQVIEVYNSTGIK